MEQHRTFDPTRAEHAGEDRTPAEEIGLILDNQPVLIEGALGSGTRLTQRWSHGAVHDSLPPMADHVIMTYYGEERVITLQGDGKRITSRIRPGSITIIPQGSDGRWDVAGSIEVSHVAPSTFPPLSSTFLFSSQSCDSRRNPRTAALGFRDFPQTIVEHRSVRRNEKEKRKEN